MPAHMIMMSKNKKAKLEIDNILSPELSKDYFSLSEPVLVGHAL
jgi:hypothetical protein